MKSKFRCSRLIVLMVSLMFGVLWSARDCRCEPSTETSAEHIQKLLASTDSVKVEIETIECWGDEGPTCGPLDIPVTELKPTELQPALEKLKVSASVKSPGWGTSVIPIIYLLFFQNKQRIGSFAIGYGHNAFDYFIEYGKMKYFFYPLDVATSRQLRELIARDEKITKALLDMGCSAKDLNPNRTRPPDK